MDRLAVFILCAGALVAQEAGQSPVCCTVTVPSVLPPLPATATIKERWLRRIHDEARADGRNEFLSARYVENLLDEVARRGADAPVGERFALRRSLALGLVRIGDLASAIAVYQDCEALCAAHPGPGRAWLPEVLFRRAAAEFRAAEKANCIARHNEDSCILPLSAKAVHLDQEGAAAAVQTLERQLALPDHGLRLQAIWLLNIAHMALGSWPDGVPEAWRIPREVFAPEAVLPRFVDRARELGLARHGHAGSVVLDDFTGDGRIDVLSCSFDTGMPLRLCRNDGDGGARRVRQRGCRRVARLRSAARASRPRRCRARAVRRGGLAGQRNDAAGHGRAARRGRADPSGRAAVRSPAPAGGTARCGGAGRQRRGPEVARPGASAFLGDSLARPRRPRVIAAATRRKSWRRRREGPRADPHGSEDVGPPNRIRDMKKPCPGP
jgi:hypothetical protein